MNEYKNPKIFSDLLALYKMCYKVNQGIPKLFRITVSEKMLNEIIDCMRLTAVANFKKSDVDSPDTGVSDLKEMRARIEIIKAYALISWDMKHFSHGFYAEISKKIEEISKQAASWEKWIKGRVKNGSVVSRG